MLQITKESKGGALLVRLTGSIEESVDFEKVIGPVSGDLVVNCKGVPRINSVGVKAWIKYFQALQQKGTKLTFEECSTAIVEQINLISNFTCGGTVDSIFVPFSCETCKSELVGLFKTEALKKLDLDHLPPMKCTKCSGQAIFDDLPDEYFGFLKS